MNGPNKTLMAMRKQLANPKAPPKEHPATLAQGDFKMLPDVFQYRRECAEHVKILAAALGRTERLEPITIWWGGKGWICIDGHHRTQAYRVASKTLKKTIAVSVRVFVGTLDEALMQAAKGNSRDKLSMQPSEKQNAAWRLTVTTAATIPRVAQAAGVSERAVSSMRAVRATLLTQQRNDASDPLDTPARWAHLSDLSWHQARMLALGQTLEEFDRDSQADKRGREIAKAIHKAVGPMGWKDPEAFMRGIALYSPLLWKTIQDELTVTADDADQWEFQGEGRKPLPTFPYSAPFGVSMVKAPGQTSGEPSEF